MALAVENWRKTMLSIADDCCRQHPTSFPGHFSLALEVGLSPPPKPGISALGTRLNNTVSVNIACVAGVWKYLGAEKNRRAKGRHARVERNTCLPRARRSLFISKRLLRRLYWTTINSTLPQGKSSQASLAAFVHPLSSAWSGPLLITTPLENLLSQAPSSGSLLNTVNQPIYTHFQHLCS